MFLDMGERGDWDRVAPFVACLCMALYQSQADWGHWTNAVLMMPVADPVAGEEWGGTPEMLQGVYSYRRAMQDLKEHLTKDLKAAEEPAGGQHEKR